MEKILQGIPNIACYLDDVLITAKNETGSLDTKLARLLIVYRSTPNTTTGESPAELLFHRQICTRLSLLTPSASTTVDNKQTDQRSHHDTKSKERQ